MRHRLGIFCTFCGKLHLTGSLAVLLCIAMSFWLVSVTKLFPNHLVWSEVAVKKANNDTSPNVIQAMAGDSSSMRDESMNSSHSVTVFSDPNISNVSRQRPMKLSLAFVGDSITRYQYLSLIYFLHSGKWLNDSEIPNILMENTYESWNDFYNKSTKKFQGKEECNCFRGRRRFNNDITFENRYFADKTNNNYVAYIQKMGRLDAHGHWDPAAVYRQGVNTSSLPKGVPGWYKWIYNWTGVIRQHLALLDPKPDFVIFNAGIWPNDLNNRSYLNEIRHALDDTGITGIYKTTTRSIEDFQTHSEPHDVLACKIMHHCFNLSWTANLTGSSNYWDKIHFFPHVYNKFNRLLLELLAALQRKDSHAEVVDVQNTIYS